MPLRRTPLVLLLLAQSLLAQYVSYAARPALSYAMLDHESASFLLGLTAAIYALPSMLLALPIGVLIDRLGERPLAIAGSFSLVASAALMLFGQPSVLLLVVSAGVLGLGHLLVVASGQAMVANSTSDRSLDAAFGYYALMASFGQALGPLTLTLPGDGPDRPPLDTVFLLCLGCAALSVILSFVLPSTSRAEHAARAGVLSVASSLLRSRGVAAGLATSGMVLASIDVLTAYLPLIAQSYGLPVAVVGIMLTARAVASMVSRAGLGPIVARFGRMPVLVASAASSGVFLAMMALPLNAVALVAVAAAFGFTVGACQPLTMSWVSAVAPAGTRGLAMSLRLASNRLAQTVVPAAAGALAIAGGGTVVLLAVAVGLGAVAAAAWTSARRP